MGPCVRFGQRPVCKKMKLRCYYEAKRLTRELQEIGFVAEDQVVVGNEVEEPDVQLLRVVALEENNVGDTF